MRAKMKTNKNIPNYTETNIIYIIYYIFIFYYYYYLLGLYFERACERLARR